MPKLPPEISNHFLKQQEKEYTHWLRNDLSRDLLNTEYRIIHKLNQEFHRLFTIQEYKGVLTDYFILLTQSIYEFVSNEIITNIPDFQNQINYKENAKKLIKTKSLYSPMHLCLRIIKTQPEEITEFTKKFDDVKPPWSW